MTNVICRQAQIGRTRRRRRNAANGRWGGAIVESAFVLPLMLLFLFGIMEYGRYVLCLQVVTNAAREGCRYAVTHVNPVTLNGVTTGNATTDVTNVVTSFLAGQQLTSQSISVYQSDNQGTNIGTWTNADPGQYIAVQVKGNFQVTVPKLLSFPSSIPVTATVVMICEGN
ncbi:MAG TPA: TadE/TadG family type IV pilus assembly protein [Pirellulales bacterium]|nr:TadE/TadG family type IV pilus assembly protein [Pirellulales bacterium]